MANITLTPIADSFVWELNPNNNYGSDPLLYTWTQNATRNRRSFLKFDLSSLPSGAVITLAKLRIKVDQVYGLVSGVTDIQARRVSVDTWTEGGITWNNQPTMGNVEDTKVPAVGWVEWNVLAWVQNEWAGDKVVSIGLRCVTESYDATARWAYLCSKENIYGAGSNPQLYIEYTTGVAHSKTIAEKMGFVDGHSKKQGHKKTIAEKVGFTDEHDKDKCKKCKPSSVTVVF